MKLSKRLQAVADCVPVGSRVADIGSDHAKVPIWLVTHHVIEYVVAGEVARGPYEIAREAAKIYVCIQVRLADGLSALTEADKIDTVIIAGMGGALIQTILSAGDLTGIKRLILQPNNEEAALRYWLMAHGWTFSEQILEEKGKIYELLVAVRGFFQLTATQLQFGRLTGPVFEKKWRRRLAEIEKILLLLPTNNTNGGSERQKLLIEKKQIEEVLENDNCP